MGAVHVGKNSYWTRRRRRYWKHGLCSCLRQGAFCRSSIPWKALCCPRRLMADVWTRTTTDPLPEAPFQRLAGLSNPIKLIGTLVVLVVVLVCCFSWWAVAAPSSSGTLQDHHLDAVLRSTACLELLYACYYVPMSCFTFMWLVHLRRNVRTSRGIRTGFLGRAEDVCCVLMCRCCTLTQVAHQVGETKAHDSTEEDEVDLSVYFHHEDEEWDCETAAVSY